MNEPLYKEELLEHYRHPRNYGELSDAHVTVQVSNPACGDSVTMQLRIEEGRVTGIAFQGKGCVISQAATSLLTLSVLNKPLEELKQFTVQGILDLLGISLGPTRMRCALLSLETLQRAIDQYQKEDHA